MDCSSRWRREFSMEWQITDTDVRKRVMLLVSREDHCLADLLYRWRSGDMECDITSVVSNHEDLRSFVEWHEIPFHAVPVRPKPAKGRRRSRRSNAYSSRTSRCHGARPVHADPPGVAMRRVGRARHQHPPQLPAVLRRSRPYHQAFARGVKLIGATCHYVTADLDEGPIIEQDTRRIDHADSPRNCVGSAGTSSARCWPGASAGSLEDAGCWPNGSKTVVFGVAGTRVCRQDSAASACGTKAVVLGHLGGCVTSRTDDARQGLRRCATGRGTSPRRHRGRARHRVGAWRGRNEGTHRSRRAGVPSRSRGRDAAFSAGCRKRPTSGPTTGTHTPRPPSETPSPERRQSRRPGSRARS